jgi:hypothetical protein
MEPKKKNTYRFSEHAPTQVVEVNKNGVIRYESVKGLYPFGPQCALVTDENLTDSMAEYLLAKKDENGEALHGKDIVKAK